MSANIKMTLPPRGGKGPFGKGPSEAKNKGDPPKDEASHHHDQKHSSAEPAAPEAPAQSFSHKGPASNEPRRVQRGESELANSNYAQIQEKNAKLYELQQALLSAPKPERKAMKIEIAALDREIAKLSQTLDANDPLANMKAQKASLKEKIEADAIARVKAKKAAEKKEQNPKLVITANAKAPTPETDIAELHAQLCNVQEEIIESPRGKRAEHQKTAASIEARIKAQQEENARRERERRAREPKGPSYMRPTQSSRSRSPQKHPGSIGKHRSPSKGKPSPEKSPGYMRSTESFRASTCRMVVTLEVHLVAPFGFELKPHHSGGALVVCEVRPGGAAEAAGISCGDRILRVGECAVDAPHEFIEHLHGLVDGTAVVLVLDRDAPDQELRRQAEEWAKEQGIPAEPTGERDSDVKPLPLHRLQAQQGAQRSTSPKQSSPSRGSARSTPRPQWSSPGTPRQELQEGPMSTEDEKAWRALCAWEIRPYEKRCDGRLSSSPYLSPPTPEMAVGRSRHSSTFRTIEQVP